MQQASEKEVSSTSRLHFATKPAANATASEVSIATAAIGIDSNLRLPEIIDLEKLPCWKTRNQAITDWYHKVDLIFSAYLGDESLPTWARFAKHASYNAGITLKEINRSIDIVEGLLNSAQSILDAVTSFNPRKACAGIQNLRQTIKNVLELSKSPDSLHCAAIASLIELQGPTEFNQNLAKNFQSAPTSWKNTFECMVICFTYLPAILEDLPETLENLKKLSSTVTNSNARIYTFMAPKLDAFFRSEILGETPSRCSEPEVNCPDLEVCGRFLTEALLIYKSAKALPSTALARRSFVTRANLLATYGEQLYRVQPEFSLAGGVIDNLKTLMRFHFPDGSSSPLGPFTSSWSNLHQRFGLKSSLEITDPKDLQLSSLLEPTDLALSGTIGEMLLKGGNNVEFALSLLSEPPNIN